MIDAGKHTYLLLAALAAALLLLFQGANVTAGRSGGEREPLPTFTATAALETTEATATQTAAATFTVTPTETATSTSTPSPTATPGSSPSPSATPTPQVYAHYLPLVTDIPPPMPPGCRPVPHLPAASLSNEWAMSALLNDYRRDNGLAALNNMPHLVQAARRHAYDMAANDFVGHTGSDDSSAGERAGDACYEWYAIAQMVGSSPSVLEMFNAWTTSPGNRALILSAEYLDFGTAYAYDPLSDPAHAWVVVLGRPTYAGLREQE